MIFFPSLSFFEYPFRPQFVTISDALVFNDTIIIGKRITRDRLLTATNNKR